MAYYERPGESLYILEFKVSPLILDAQALFAAGN